MHVPRCGGDLSRHCLRSSPRPAGRSTTRYNPHPNPHPPPPPPPPPPHPPPPPTPHPPPPTQPQSQPQRQPQPLTPTPNPNANPNQVDYPLQHGISAAEIDLLLGDGDGAQPGTPHGTQPGGDAAEAVAGGAAGEAAAGAAAGAAGVSYGGRVSLQVAARLCVLRDDGSGDAAALQTDEAIRRVLLGGGSISTRNDLDAAQLVSNAALAQRGVLLEAEAAAVAAAAAAAEAAAVPCTRAVCAEMAAALRASEALALDRLSGGGAVALFDVSS
jgi:hypothetical protein